MTKIYFSKKRAFDFQSNLKEQGFEAQVWIDTDAFGDKVYIVKW